MTLQRNPPREAHSTVAPLPPGPSRENWLPIARRAWIGLALVLMVYFVVSIPVFYQGSLTVCTPSDAVDCSHALVTDGNVQALSRLHLSVVEYVRFLVAFRVATSLLALGIGLLIFLRRSREWTGLFFSLVLVLFSATAAASTIAGVTVTAQTPLLLQLLVTISGILSAVNNAAFPAFLLTFPTGRLAPRWSWVLIVLLVVLQNGPNLLPDLGPNLDSVIGAAVTILWALSFVVMLGVQVYRYARVYDGVQRQQTKWFVFALGVAISLLVIPFAASIVVPSLAAPDSWYQLISNADSAVFGVLLVSSVGVAILRYRLWDIDVLINRALVYTSLTALLAALYIGLILALQALVRVLTGSLTQQPLVLVGSTLVIAALFQPLRRRLQATIDGRFYRRKYDAAQVVAAFSSTLHQEVDLDQLREQLVAVVQETMQPKQVSVWLRPYRPDAGGRQ